jgi:hypothetical protein
MKKEISTFWLVLFSLIIIGILFSGCLKTVASQQPTPPGNSELLNNSINNTTQCSVCNSTPNTGIFDIQKPHIPGTTPTRPVATTPTKPKVCAGARCPSMEMSCCAYACYDPKVMTCVNNEVVPIPTRSGITMTKAMQDCTRTHGHRMGMSCTYPDGSEKFYTSQ